MNSLIIVFLLIIIAAVSYYLRQLWIKKRRAALFATPLSSEAVALIEHTTPIYQRLPASLQQQLQGHIQIFLDEKKFYGFDGIEINDEIRLTVAANACLLILNRPSSYFPSFRSIYVYPSTYIAIQQRHEGALKTESQQHRHGESWFRGPIVLAWDASIRGAMDMKDGHNVILHEFAHKLDEEDGQVDGAPALGSHSRYSAWAKAMYPEYKTLLQQARRGQNSVLDHYGATNPAEFFAVLVETFFEKPRQLQSKHPELYRQLKLYFQLDPAQWQRPH